MNDMLPEGWEVDTLINLSINGINNGVFNDPKKVGKGYKLINVIEMYKRFGIDINTLKLLDIDKKEFNKNKVEYGDVFFTRSSLKLEGIAYCNINLSHNNDITYDGHLMRIRPDKKRIYPKYIAYYCLSDFARVCFMAHAKHSTMTTIGQADIAPLKVIFPPLPEQKKIASILSSIDEVIEKTTAQVAKLKDLKTSLMQALLTKGIGHSEFKDSPVGRIPVEWEVVELDNLGSFKNGLNKSKEDFGFGTKFINISDAYPSTLDTLNLSRVHVNEKEIKQYKLEYGDIIFVRSSVKPSGVGYPTLFIKDKEPVVYSGFMIRFRTQSTSIDAKFLLFSFRGELFRNELLKVSTISANTNINQVELGKLKTVIPPLKEQKEIAKILTSLDQKITTTNQKLSALTHTKKALMQDLLTGKKRVTV